MAPRHRRPRRSRSRLRHLLAAAATVGMVCCGTGDQAGDAPEAWTGLDFEAIAETLLERMSLEPGERVLLVGQSGRWDELLEPLQAGIRAAGAVDLGAVDVFGRPLPAGTPAEVALELESRTGDLVEALSGVDLGVMLPGAVSTEAETDVYRAMQDVLRGGRGRTVHFHWSGATAFDMAALPEDDRVDQVYQRALLDTDYEELAHELSAFEAAMRDNRVRVTTPGGTDLSFEIGDRPVTRQDGDASAGRAASARNLIDLEVELPAGAARVSPIVETVNGRIAFPAADWGGVRVEGLILEFEDGRVTGVQATVGEEGVQAELEAAGPAGRTFRELAVGFNPLLAIPEGEEWIPYYGYGAGVVRLSLGDNTELGGSVGGGYVRWNFFTDATVYVGGQLWVRGGRRVVEAG